MTGVHGVSCGARGLPQRLASSRQHHSGGSRGLALRTCREPLLLGPQAAHTWARFHWRLRSPLKQALAREEAEAEAEGPGPTRPRRRSLQPGPAPASLGSETGGERRCSGKGQDASRATAGGSPEAGAERAQLAEAYRGGHAENVDSALRGMGMFKQETQSAVPSLRQRRRSDS